MRVLFAALIVCLQLSLIWATSTTQDPSLCHTGCTCQDSDADDSSVTKHEGMAAAVGALTPLVVGGAGLGLYKLLKGSGGSSPSVPGTEGPDFSSPRYNMNKAPPTYPDSPDTYHDMRRGSTPVSMFGEDDDISFNDSLRGPGSGSSMRPDTSSIVTNIHRPKTDAINRWM